MQPAVNQYFTGSILWRDDIKTESKERREREGERKKRHGQEQRIYPDILWQSFPQGARGTRPVRGADTDTGEGTPLDKSLYSPLASTAHTPSPKGRHSCDILWTKGCLFWGASWETPEDTTGNRPSLPRFTDWEAEKQLSGEVSVPFACLS